MPHLSSSFTEIATAPLLQSTDNKALPQQCPKAILRHAPFRTTYSMGLKDILCVSLLFQKVPTKSVHSAAIKMGKPYIYYRSKNKPITTTSEVGLLALVTTRHRLLP